MKRILAGLLLVLSLCIIATACGGLLARFAVDKSDGLAAGAMIVMSGMAGGVAGLAGGTLLVLFGAERLKRRLTILAAPLALLVATTFSFMMWRIDQQYKDPESAYQGLADYRIEWTQIVVSDPYLATYRDIDTDQREWQAGRPEGKMCSGRLRAKVQAAVGDALLRLVTETGNPGEACDDFQDDPTQMLVWQLSSADGIRSDGRLPISEQCLASRPHLASLIATLTKASIMMPSKTRCEDR